YMPTGAERSAATTRDLFAAAALDVSRFARIPVPPMALPPVPADHLEAWQARGAKTVVLAGTTKGTPVLFEVRDDPQAPMPSLEAETTADVVVFISLLAFIAVAAAILARRNLNMGRGDARGAARLALFVLAFWLGSWNLIASLEKILEGIAYGVFIATLVWLAYVALEPHVRRRWPRTLVSWNRLLQGRFRDPLVGRDLLAGMFAAAVLRLILFFAAGAAGEESPHKATSYPGVLRMLGEVLFYDVWLAVIETFAFLFLLYAATLVVRKRVIALVAVIALLSAMFFAVGGTAIVGVAGVLVMLHRFGLLAGIATCYGLFLQAEMKTFEFGRWYGAPSLLAMLIAGALLLWAFMHARDSLRRPLPDFRQGLH
ncbi:MAG TPA: hypothetical protein VHL59_11515, partial [Thermoanaerobaculia bacterium]|nr:hypothetical protein [Thermoanaerobaculia bacterium]